MNGNLQTLFWERVVPVSCGVLLVIYFALAPWVPRAITLVAGFIAILAAVVGWRGLKLLPADAHKLFLAFILYVFLALISLFHNENWSAAGFRFEKYHPFLFAIPIMGWMALSGKQLGGYVAAAVVAAGVAFTSVAFYEHLVLHVERVGESSGLNPNTFGHISSLIALALAGFGLYSDYRRVYRLLFLVLAFTTIYATLSSGTRGAAAALLAGAMAMAGTYLIYHDITRKTALLLVGIFTGVVLLMVLVFYFSDFWRAHWMRLIDEPARFLAGDTTYTSTAARATMWISGWKTGMANFWIGTGIGDNQIDYDRLMAAGELPHIAGNSNFHLHNIYIDAFASTGIIGLLTMLFAVFVMPLKYFLKTLKDKQVTGLSRVAAIIGISILADCFVFGMSYSWLYIRGLHFFLLLLLPLLVLAGGYQRREPNIPPNAAKGSRKR